MLFNQLEPSIRSFTRKFLYIVAEMRTCLRSLINAVSASFPTSDKTPSTNHKSIDVLTEIIDPRFSVDFLTEAIRQFSEATLNGRSLSSVTTKTMSTAGTLNVSLAGTEIIAPCWC